MWDIFVTEIFPYSAGPFLTSSCLFIFRLLTPAAWIRISRISGIILLLIKRICWENTTCSSFTQPSYLQVMLIIIDKAQNGTIGNISENWTQKWTAGPDRWSRPHEKESL